MFNNQIALFICLIFSFSTVYAEQETIKIGVIAPITGPLADQGRDVSRTAKLIEKQLNNGDHKFRYQFIVQNGKCGASSLATNAANMLINFEKVKYLITSCSGTTLQAAPIAKKNKVLTIAILSSHKDIKHLGDYVFRTFIDIENVLEDFAKKMAKHSNNKLAILTEENTFTTGIKNIIVKEIPEAIIFNEDYPSDTADFQSLLTKVKGANPEGVYVSAVSERSLTDVIKQSRRIGLNPQFYTFVMPENATYRELAGTADEGLIFIGHPIITNSSDEYQSIYQEYLKTYQEPPVNELLLRTLFDAAYSIYLGTEAVGTDTTKVKDYLFDISFLGATGTVEYDQNGDIKNLNYTYKKIVNSKKTAYSFE